MDHGLVLTHPREIGEIIRSVQETGAVLTISELARYAGVTVRAVRHYHAEGLLPEPERRDRA